MEWVLQVDQYWQLWPSCHTQCLVNRADGNKLGINKDLHAMWKMFDESPARRDIYIRETDFDIFPLHFWKSRWVEDEPVAAWGIQIWKNIFQVVKYWLSLLKSKHPCNNKSFDTLVKYKTDKLMILRLFLLQFQTSKPMIPFLVVELNVTLKQYL